MSKNDGITITHWHDPSRTDTSPFRSLQESAVDSPIDLHDRYLFLNAANKDRIDERPRNVPPGAALPAGDRIRGVKRPHGAVVGEVVRKDRTRPSSSGAPRPPNIGHGDHGNSRPSGHGQSGLLTAEKDHQRTSKFQEAGVERMMQDRQQSRQQSQEESHGRPVPVMSEPATPRQPVQFQQGSPKTPGEQAMMGLQGSYSPNDVEPVRAMSDQYNAIEGTIPGVDINRQKEAWLLQWDLLRSNKGFEFTKELTMDDDLAAIRFTVLSTQNEIAIRNKVERTKKMIRGPIKFVKAISDAVLGHVVDLDGTKTEGGVSLIDSVDEALDNAEKDLEVIVSAGGALDVKPTRQQALSSIGTSIITTVGDVLMTNNMDRVVGLVVKKFNLGPAKAKKEKEEKKRLKKEKKEEEEALARKKMYEEIQASAQRAYSPYAGYGGGWPYGYPMPMGPAPPMHPQMAPHPGTPGYYQPYPGAPPTPAGFYGSPHVPFHQGMPQPSPYVAYEQQGHYEKDDRDKEREKDRERERERERDRDNEKEQRADRADRERAKDRERERERDKGREKAEPEMKRDKEREKDREERPAGASTPAAFSMVQEPGEPIQTPVPRSGGNKPARRKFPTCTMPVMGSPMP